MEVERPEAAEDDPILDLNLGWLTPEPINWKQAHDPAVAERIERHLEERAWTLQEDTLHPFLFLTEYVKTLNRNGGTTAPPWGTVDSTRDAPQRIFILGHNHWNATQLLAEACLLYTSPSPRDRG